VNVKREFCRLHTLCAFAIVHESTPWTSPTADARAFPERSQLSRPATTPGRLFLYHSRAITSNITSRRKPPNRKKCVSPY